MKLFLIAGLLLAGSCLKAQLNPTDLDKSPMDMSYCPANYPILKMNGKTTEPPVARLVYSRPQKSGRVIFGSLVKYGQVWRLGANEATELEFFRSVKINGKTVPKGRYTFYAICQDNKWTLIINKEKDIWGLAYNPNKDLLRVDVPVQQMSTSVEALTMYFETITGGAHLIILWDQVKVVLPISY